MARPAFRNRGGAPGESGRVVHLDRDRALVEAARRDPAAFDALYRRYLAQVYSFAYYELGHHADAEDVTERVFLQALTALPRFEERADLRVDGHGVGDASTFRVWLFQIARNAIVSELRQRRRRATTSLDTIDEPVDDRDPAAAALTRVQAMDALAAVNDLPADRRRALILRFVDELSTAEIARVLGRSEASVRVLIHRALRSVARRLERDAPG